MDKKRYMYGLSDRLQFGKYRGQMLQDVLKRDSRYVLWCIREVEAFDMTVEAWEYAIGTNAHFASIRPSTDTNSIELLDYFPWKDIKKAQERFRKYVSRYAEDAEIITLVPIAIEQ